MADTEGGGGTGGDDGKKQQQQSSARAKAEARRRRILEASGERLGVVSGEQAAKPAAAAAAAGAEGGAGEDDAAAEAKPAGGGSSAASRYAQARRRRFKQKAAAATAATDAESKTDEAGGANDAAAAADDGAGAAADEGKAAESKPENEEPTTDAGGETTTAAATDEGGMSAADEKKYKGVAYMRRKRLAEKKQREEEEAEAAGPSEVHRSPSGRKLGVPPSLSTVARSTVRQRRGPVVLHLLTVALLFLAGVGIGVRNSPGTVDGPNDGVVVTRALSLGENGVGALRLLGVGSSTSGIVDEAADLSKKDARERLLDESSGGAELRDDGSVVEGDDEFEDAAASAEGSAKPKGADGAVPNIDPLFRVDLDEVTAGPGFLMAAARLAVKFHRALMYLILVLPVTVVQSILALPRALLSSPPIPFFLCVVIRYVGRDVLGAQLPDVETITGQDSEDQAGGKDILTTLMRTAKAQLSATFPKMVSAFTIVKDARSDMYVILCGLFVGLVLPVHLGGAGVPGGEEL